MGSPASPTTLEQAQNWSAFALGIAPVVLQLVATIQSLFGRGGGKKKAKVAQTVIKAVAPNIPEEAVQPLIDASVVAMKEAGHPAF